MSRSGQPPDLKKYMDKKLQTSYLNPNLQYQDARLGYDVEMLDALRRVINRMEPDTIRAAAAVDEIKIFREGSQGFADRLAIHSRDKTKLVKLNANRVVVGTLRGFDQFMNLVIDNTLEVNNGNEKNDIGMVVIRGNSIVMIEALEPIQKTQ